nr:hypothetical protein [Tanacetum cinerariifolium]
VFGYEDKEVEMERGEPNDCNNESDMAAQPEISLLQSQGITSFSTGQLPPYQFTTTGSVPARRVRAEYQEEDEAGTIVTGLTFIHILNLM